MHVASLITDFHAYAYCVGQVTVGLLTNGDGDAGMKPVVIHKVGAVLFCPLKQKGSNGD